MDNKKTSIKDFQLQRKDRNKDETSKPETKEEARGASPVLGGSKTGSGLKRIERKSIRLPVTGEEIELTSIDVIPSECLIHPKNQRIQALLTLSNPKVTKLRDSFLKEGQREPVLSRWINDSGTRVLEVLDGSRRRFVCDDIYKADGTTRLKAWVGNISDADAEYLAKSGNDDRDDISPWELSQYLKSIELSHPNWSHEVIAANEGMSRTNVSNLIAIADIPLGLVALLESPDLLKVNSGLKVVKLVREAKDQGYITLLEKFSPFTKFSDLANRLNEILKPKPVVETPSANRKVEIKVGKKVRATIGANRKKAGQYKVDLFDVSDEEYQRLVSSLENLLK